jgi:hypothetical protein
MWTYLLGPLLALLPVRWRARLVPEAPVNWPAAGLISGIVESTGSLLGLIGWYLHAMQKYMDAQLGATMTATKGVPGEGSAYAMGFAAFVTFLVHPLTWALFYFWLEGALRTLAALLTEESPGTLPLVLVDRAWRVTQRRREQARVPLVRDDVAQGDGKQPWDMKIASCRPKPSWKYPLAIRYEGEFYQVVGEASAVAMAARPHVYLLRRANPREPLRGLEHYDPESVLRGDADPGAVSVLLHELRKRWQARRAPLVPDEVRETIGRDAAGLEVRSCRPKPDWTPGRLVSYADAYYRIVGSRMALRPRPFIFTLEKLAAGVPGRNVLRYTPEDPFERAR